MISILLMDQNHHPIRWRQKIDVFIHKDGKFLVGYSPTFKTLLTPGGGVEAGQTLKKAAEIECLEELGVRIKNFKLIPNSMYPFIFERDLSEAEKKLPKMIERMKIYKGIKIYFAKADFDDYDKSLLGRDKDAMKPRLVTKDKLIEEFRKNSQGNLSAHKIKILEQL